MNGGPGSSASSFAEEWDAAQRAATDRITGLLAELGMSEAGRAYVASLRLYLRAPFLTTLWIADARERRRLAVAVATHLLGIKLVDDLLDGDSDLPAHELGLGVQLIQTATRLLATGDRPAAVLAELDDEYRHIWRGQLAERGCRLDSVAEWLELAELNAARVFGCYAAVASLAGGAAEAVPAAREFARNFGLLVRLADDLVDYHRQGERRVNFGVLLAGSRVSDDEVVRLVESWRRAAHAALRSHPPVVDPAPVVDDYADDLLERILPAFAVEA